MPRIINPNASKSTAQALIDRLSVFFSGNPNVRAVSFDQVRAAHLDFSGLTDGQIAQLAQDAGFKVEG